MVRWLTAGLLGMLLVIGCGDEICDAYACLNGAYFRATMPQPEAQLLDVRFCEGKVCRSGQLDLAPKFPACVAASPAEICPSPRDGELEINARWAYGTDADEPADGLAYQLVVSDHESGEVLFDETRTASFEVRSEDGCHRCWSAELDATAP